MQAKALKYHNAEAQWAMQAASNFVGTEAPDFTATAVFHEEFVDVPASSFPLLLCSLLFAALRRLTLTKFAQLVGRRVTRP